MRCEVRGETELLSVVRYDESEHSVRCILNIENWTTWLLTDPSVRTHCGHISDLFPPPVVFPATREVMEGYKTVSLHLAQFELRGKC